MSTAFEELRNDKDMWDFEYRHAFADSHLNSMIAMQIKALREQRDWSQAKLGEESQMAQPRISLLEDVNYSAWSINTLRKLARAFDLRLKVSFEEFGSLRADFSLTGPSGFYRRSFEEDPRFNSATTTTFAGSSSGSVAFAWKETIVAGSSLRPLLVAGCSGAQTDGLEVAAQGSRNEGTGTGRDA